MVDKSEIMSGIIFNIYYKNQQICNADKLWLNRHAKDLHFIGA